MGYTTTACITETAALAGHDSLRLADGLSTWETDSNGSPDALLDVEQYAIDRFCDQCLQLEQTPDYPDGNLLKRADVQNEIFDRICADRQEPLPGNARLQLRVLKELVNRIQASISDDEVDEYVRLVLLNHVCLPLSAKKSLKQSKTGSFRQYHGPDLSACPCASSV